MTHHPDTTLSPAPSARPDLVARLRTAGCVFAEDEALLLTEAARTPAELDAMTDRRAAGLPLEHVVGWARFAGLRTVVGPGVFVPRRRTEFLVEQAVARATAARGAGPRPSPLLVDLCCGNGAVGLAVATALHGRARLHAADVDPAAVRCARRNLAGLAQARVHRGDLFAALPTALRGHVDVLTANVPYVPSADLPLLPPEARDHEPRTALDGGPDGLALLRRVAAHAPRWLAPGGCLLTETSEAQAEAARTLLTDAGLTARIARHAPLDATVLLAERAT